MNSVDGCFGSWVGLGLGSGPKHMVLIISILAGSGLGLSEEGKRRILNKWARGGEEGDG
jgi:hypothetical protein